MFEQTTDSQAHEGSSLALDADVMRQLGYRTIDMLVDRITGPPGPVVTAESPGELHRRLSMPPPEQPANFDEILDDLERDVLPYVARLAHPGYLAYIPGEGTWPGALGDLISSALNIDACWWLGASGPAALELAVLDWFRQWVGYPAEAGGALVSGGSAANLTALACAREALMGEMDARAVLYMSDQAHSSLARAARVLGFGPDQVRVILSDHVGRMRPDALEGAIGADLAAGRRPLLVVANAGSTAVGAIDPFTELSRICREHDAWLHVDGAYGAFGCLTERGRAALAGMELADSITLDPHKWLYQPVEVGALLVRDGDRLRRSFEIHPSYLKGTEAVDREVNFSDLGVQLTRSCRALKLWISLRYFGVDAFRQAIDRCIDLALHAQRRVERSPELELMSPASLGVVALRRHPAGVDDERVLERINTDLVQQIEAGGEVFVSSGQVRGRHTLRLCVLNHSTTASEVDRAIDLLETLPVDLAPRSAEGGAGAGAPAGSLELFATLGPDQLALLRSAATEIEVDAGEVVLGRWQTSRDMYVVLSGAVRVEGADATLGRLLPGQFFGELAALDWGASFGRARSADVIADEPTRLLRMDWHLTDQLMKEAPGFAEVVERVARERLGTL
ncbi:MAG TPA: aminotransferase class V-fold PLP-dependent enzyme [Gaiellales bacterium]|nr:aminotransferase class V-fold PLP-dependent enzyme [Gaiellales bacterium]